MKKIVLVISFIRLIPHVFFYKLSKNKKTIQYDINRWLAITQKEKRLGFTTLMTFYPQFRNLFYKD